MRMRLGSVVSALLAVAVIGVTAGCSAGATSAGPQPGGAAAGGTPSDAGGAGATSAGGGTVAVPQSLVFTAKTLDGQPFQGATLAGKPVLLWFWAPWCATCAGQAPSVADAKAAYGDRMNFVGVAGMGDATAMRKFVEEFELGGVTQLNDQPGEVWRRFKIVEQSTYVFLDRNGRIVHQGWMDSLQFDQQVAALAG